jgi:Interferon-induced transmembrane protein/zinc-ribbon domain
MYCPNCGAQNDDDATYCTNCGNALQQISTPNVDVPSPPQPQGQALVPNYLAQAILTTLFCCLPFGIVSIVFAAQVHGKLAAGDRAGALQSSQNAKTWAWLSFGFGIAFWVIFIFIPLL